MMHPKMVTFKREKGFYNNLAKSQKYNFLNNFFLWEGGFLYTDKFFYTSTILDF